MTDIELGVDDVTTYPVRFMVGGPRNTSCSNGWFTMKMLWALRGFDKSEVVIIEGAAKGIDTRAYEFAKKHGYAFKRVPADWDAYTPKKPGGKNPAGMIRNGTMLRMATHYLAFWDYKSRGTGGAITEAKKMIAKGVPLRIAIIRLPEENT